MNSHVLTFLSPNGGKLVQCLTTTVMKVKSQIYQCSKSDLLGLKQLINELFMNVVFTIYSLCYY